MLLIVTPISRDFFELDLPRPAILLAGAGIVAITGAAMIGTLRGVGWIKTVPGRLRERPPDARKFWETTVERVRSFGDRVAPSIDDDAFTGSTAAESPSAPPAPAEPQASSKPAEANVPDPLEHARTIDWFDPDVDPIDVLNEPTVDPARDQAGTETR